MTRIFIRGNTNIQMLMNGDIEIVDKIIATDLKLHNTIIEYYWLVIEYGGLRVKLLLTRDEIKQLRKTLGRIPRK